MVVSESIAAIMCAFGVAFLGLAVCFHSATEKPALRRKLGGDQGAFGMLCRQPFAQDRAGDL
jgi:hypothetical protein